MKTLLRTDGIATSFVLSDVEPACHDAVRGLAYQPAAEGFARSFPSDTPGLDRIYAHFERSAAAMVRQAARQQPVPWEDTLEALMDRIRGHALHWYLVGSTALAVRGIEVAPGDVDIVTDDDGAERLNDLLAEYLVEPPQRSPGWIWDSFGRAFLGGRLEWVGGVNAGADRPAVSDFGPAAASRLEVVTWRGVDIRVPPLDLQLAVSERRGMTDRADRIRERLLRSRRIGVTEEG